MLPLVKPITFRLLLAGSYFKQNTSNRQIATSRSEAQRADIKFCITAY